MSGVSIVLDNRLRISGWLPRHVLTRLSDRFTFDNPAYFDAKKRGRSTRGMSRFITGYEMAGDAITLPRGAIRQVLVMMKREGLDYHINDHRRTMPPVEFSFQGELRDFQRVAVDAILARQFGTLSAPTGSGKTVIALYIIAARKQPALVVVHTKELLHQWLDRAGTFLGIPREEIGVIGGGEKRLGRELTVAIVNSLYPIAHEVREHIGHLVVDECHRCPSRTFTEAISAFDSMFMLGLSATPWRRDKLTRLIYWNVGDKVHEIEQGALQDTGDVLKPDIIVRGTDFVSSWDASSQYQQMLSELTMSLERNWLIIKDVLEEVRKGRGTCLVLTDRKAHCEELAVLMTQYLDGVETLTGDMSKSRRVEVVERLDAGKVLVLVATTQLIGEGLDCPRLSSLFLANPIRSSGRLIQCLGRVLRPAPGKERPRVYDYVDVRIGVLRNAFRARQRVYGGGEP